MRLRTSVFKSPSRTDLHEDSTTTILDYSFLNVSDEVPVEERPDLIMGLGSNHALSPASDFSDDTMVEEFLPNEKNLSSSSDTSESPTPMSSVHKWKTSPILRLRNKAMSRSERNIKGKSTSEMSSKAVRKTVSDALDVHRRPTSQFYDLEDQLYQESSESPGVPNLLRLTSVSSGSQPILSAIDQLSTNPEGSSGMLSRYLSLRTSTPHLSAVDNFLQKFRKSIAFRFQKKKTEEVVNGTDVDLLNCSPVKTVPEILNCSPVKTVPEILNSSPVKRVPEILNCSPVKRVPVILNCSNVKTMSETLNNDITPVIRSLKDAHSPTKLQQPLIVDSSHKQFQKLVLRAVKDRKKSKRRNDVRISLIYDSIDSVSGDNSSSPQDKCNVVPLLAGSEASILRKRAASTSDYSPKSKAVQRPVSVADNLALDNSPCLKVPESKHDLLRTTSEMGHVDDLAQKNFISLDQIWRTNPVKLCRVHSRLLMCRHKGRYRLRRSISQPVELESIGSVHNLGESTHGSADQDSFQKGSLSSDDDVSSDSDIYHSFCCSPTRRSNTCWELSSEGAVYAEALWDHETSDSEELPFQAGDLIEVTDTSDREWWWGTRAGRGGWFPAAFVRLYISHRSPSNHLSGQSADGEPSPYSPCKVSMNNLSSEQVRANIVQEIVATERDYVKHLKDVVEGYLRQVHRRPDMFSKERIETVFGNIKEIYRFQSQFLKQLEERLDKETSHLSQIGNCFLNHKEDFKMYSEYCNNHPLAVSELQELYCDSQYIHFFEACRLLQEMIDISLDGFLLTPIQRICKYPLQLAELLKFTDLNHPDHIPVTKALAAMKEVAELVNERKRRMECLERLAEWQSTIEGWEGPDVLDDSSILIHCGEVTRVSSSWSRDIYVFIFDHQLVYCKKDLLKRHTYAYKGRLNLDFCDIVDVEDGKDSQFAVNVKNAWKVHCKDKEKWFLFYAKTALEKDQWLQAFKTERQRVADDKEQEFVVTEDAKKAARLAVHNKQKPKRPRAKFNKGHRRHPDVAVTELLLADPPSAKARSGSLPSNIHPELAIMAGAKLAPSRKKGSGWFHFGSGKKPKT